MGIDRRDFLTIGTVLAAGTAVNAIIPAISRASEEATPGKKQLGMIIDIDKCDPDCNACVDACNKENNVRQFDEPELDMHWIRKVRFKQRGVEDAQERSLPAMCFHCEHPPCAHVCPVEATFIRDDGIVLVDKHRCIGCRYCMIACPYKARSFVSQKVEHQPGDNPDAPLRMHGVVEKCTFCVHLVDKGQLPACVEACHKEGGGGMLFGDFGDKKSEVSRIYRSGRAQRIRADLGANPNVLYLGI